jgi:hypothetical protein
MPMAYGIRERAVMIALAARGGELSNPELDKLYKLDLKKPFREKLNRDGLVTSRQENRTFIHALTDEGWQHVENEMGAELPANAGSAGGALYALLAGLRPAAERAGGLKMLLSGLDQPDDQTARPAGDIRQQIHKAYRALAKRPQDWVQLRDLRPKVAGAAKSEVDSTLKRMFLDKEINLTLNDDQGALSQADRDAAIRIGANDMHMLSMG